MGSTRQSGDVNGGNVTNNLLEVDVTAGHEGAMFVFLARFFGKVQNGET